MTPTERQTATYTETTLARDYIQVLEGPDIYTRHRQTSWIHCQTPRPLGSSTRVLRAHVYQGTRSSRVLRAHVYQGTGSSQVLRAHVCQGTRSSRVLRAHVYQGTRSSRVLRAYVYQGMRSSRVLRAYVSQGTRLERQRVAFKNRCDTSLCVVRPIRLIVTHSLTKTQFTNCT